MNLKNKIVVLEDEAYIAKLLVYKLSAASYDVRLFESPENVFEDWYAVTAPAGAII